MYIQIYILFSSHDPPVPLYTRLLCHDFSKTSIHARIPAARLYNLALSPIEPLSRSCVSGGPPAPPLSFKPGRIVVGGASSVATAAALGRRPRLPSTARDYSSHDQLAPAQPPTSLAGRRVGLRPGGTPSLPRRQQTHQRAALGGLRRVIDAAVVRRLSAQRRLAVLCEREKVVNSCLPSRGTSAAPTPRRRDQAQFIRTLVLTLDKFSISPAVRPKNKRQSTAFASLSSCFSLFFFFPAGEELKIFIVILSKCRAPRLPRNR